MPNNFTIQIEGCPVALSSDVPKRLLKQKIPSATIYAANDEKADILVQLINTGSYRIWTFSFVANQAVNLSFQLPIKRFCMLFNLAKSINIGFFDEPRLIMQPNSQNIFCTEHFKMTVYLKPANMPHELMLFDIGNDASKKTIENLRRAMSMRN